jgi:isopentenyl-diphosphate delta-isomerase
MFQELKDTPKIYCPWMIIALELLEKSEKSTLEKYENILSNWMNSSMREIYQNAIKVHLPDNNWRLVQ